ncbi:unnamed protein product [Rhizoctonia solani]|uniref:Peptidase n=1 Tax=Rhizoctonia solani TaxID=456999 RepID=A0A8H3A9U8_9AGAM|nr:peptidase [Rhizoctonia solani]KAF8681143.1 Plant basic secretory protein [Rhizoctonia solani]QRW16232.1 peptidase [Rhizoctonia solani]CAE6417579.1 unnamed protein product [Rhizoctonia solani]
MVSHDPKQPQPTNVPPSQTSPPEPTPFAPQPPSEFPSWVTEAIPELDLVIEDVLCPGATLFLTLVQPGKLLQDAVAGVLMELYDKETVPKRVKFLRVIIKETNGVAATSGDEIRKTIVFNAKYIAQVGRRAKDEILGVIRHEVVHCFQHDAQGTAPGGLIEGVADFVRLRAGFAPPHWKRGDGGGRWDSGYERTAFFLDWLERTKGAGTVKKINVGLSEGKYQEGCFWKQVLGESVDSLWERYKKSL